MNSRLKAFTLSNVFMLNLHSLFPRKNYREQINLFVRTKLLATIFFMKANQIYLGHFQLQLNNVLVKRFNG